MKERKLKIEILPNYFCNYDGKFKLDDAVRLAGQIAGVRYEEEGFNRLVNEPYERTRRRINRTFSDNDHTVYDHIRISFNIQNIPKILGMVINNEHDYASSEKSARFTKIVRWDNAVFTDEEELLYNKWLEIFKNEIDKMYGREFNVGKRIMLSQENARYLVTVFMPTQMVYTTSLRQINYIASWMRKYINNIDKNNLFEKKLALSMREFITQLDNCDVLVPELMENEKDRSLSLFGKNLDLKEEQFGDIYSTVYKGSFVYYAQAQRHRTLDYQLELLDDKEFFVPPIIESKSDLVAEWMSDIKSVGDVYPQGELVKIYELGKYDDFILKCKEKLCSGTHLEVMRTTRELLLKYRDSLSENGHCLSNDIVKYTSGARCTFPDYSCGKDCLFNEGKTLSRKV